MENNNMNLYAMSNPAILKVLGDYIENPFTTK